jgi:hypothetical protein
MIYKTNKLRLFFTMVLTSSLLFKRLCTIQVSTKIIPKENDILFRKTLAYGQSLQANILNLTFNTTLTLHGSGLICSKMWLLFSKVDCPHPYIRVRLSGSALLSVMLSFDNDGRMLHGCEYLPVPGKYYFDANLVHCHVPYDLDNFTNNTAFRILIKTPVLPDLSRPFLPFSFYIGNFSNVRPSFPPHISAWVYAPESHNHLSVAGLPYGKYISTKFQLDGWENNTHGFFSEFTHKRFDGYKWTQVQFESGVIDHSLVVDKEINEKLKFSNYSLLFWGASHIRYLRNFFQDRYLNDSSDKDSCEADFRMDNVQGRFGFYFVAFSEKFTDELKDESFRIKMQNMAMDYSYHVISLGQHEASWVTIDKPSTPRNFFHHLIMLLDQLKRITNSNSKYFILTVNQNALGDIYLRGIDWRIPPVIDAYNRELLSLTDNDLPHNTYSPLKHTCINNTFIIDNTDIMDPIWDSATDFCHPCRYGTPAIASRIIKIIEGL